MENNKSKTPTWIIVIGWFVSIIIAVIGAFGAAASSYNQKIEQAINTSANNSVIVNIDGERITLDSEKAQSIYNDFEVKMSDANSQLSDLQEEIDNLKIENSALETENKKFENWGTDALVSKDKDYDADKVSLFAFKPVNSDYWEPNQGSLNDSLNNEYSVSLPYIVVSDYSYGEYYTNGKFSKLKCKIAPHEEHPSDSSVQIKIYADDVLVYSSSDITRKTECFEFEADISNAKFIKIIFDTTSGYSTSKLLIMDATLIK